MPSHSPAAKFIEESVNHPEWLKAIEAGPAEAVVALAKEHGFECSLADLKQAAQELLPGKDGGEAGTADKAEIDEAASGMSELETDTGYGNDTGYAALYGVAGRHFEDVTGVRLSPPSPTWRFRQTRARPS